MKISLKLENKEYKGEVTEVLVPVQTYTVVAGDTLKEIAEKFNTTVEIIVTLNGIADPNVIMVGQVLRLSETTTPPTPIPPVSTDKKLVLLHCPTWLSLDNLPLTSASVFTYFVLQVAANGTLNGRSLALEAKFVREVHAAGKKACFSIAGGTQSVADITAAVTTNRVAFLNNIAANVALHNYSGVFVDIENSDLTPQVMVSFLRDLRAKLDTIKPKLFINLDVQDYQINSVWRDLAQVVALVDAVAPMHYDAGAYNFNTFAALTKQWLPKVPKEKLLTGLAVNYPVGDGGLNPAQLGEMLDFVKTEKLGGLALWQANIYTQPYRDVVKVKFPNIV